VLVVTDNLILWFGIFDFTKSKLSYNSYCSYQHQTR